MSRLKNLVKQTITQTNKQTNKQTKTPPTEQIRAIHSHSQFNITQITESFLCWSAHRSNAINHKVFLMCLPCR